MSSVLLINLIAIVVMIALLIIYPNKFKENRLQISKLIAFLLLLILVLTVSILNGRI